MAPIASRFPGWLPLVGMFLLVWGAQIRVVDRYGSDIPYWDQWDAEGGSLFLPHAQGTLEAGAFFAPHNEHRIALTRGLLFALFLLNGQWDARLECVVNAVLHAGIAVMVMAWCGAALASRWRWPAALLVAAFAALPIAWEIVLGGFHSQWYFLIGLSLAAIGGLGVARPGDRAWWAAAICAVAAIFSLGSGFFAGVAVGAATLLIIRTRADARAHAATLAVCVLVVMLGVALHHTSPGHVSSQARTPGEFFAAFQHHVGWPFEGLGWYRRPRMIVLPVLAWLPWLWLAWRVVRAGSRAQPVERVLFAVGLWTLLQFAASAYVRGVGAPGIVARYLDTVLVGIAANAFALAWIASQAGASSRWQRAFLIAATTGLAFTLTGTGLNTVSVFRRDLPRQREHLARCVENTREYLRTGDPAALKPGEIPYPDAATLVERLSHPEIRTILPVSLQPPPGRMGPWSRVAELMARGGLVIAAAGVVLLGLAAWRDRRRDATETAAAPAIPARRE